MIEPRTASFEALISIKREFSYVDIGNSLAVTKMVDSAHAPTTIPAVLKTRLASVVNQHDFCEISSAESFAKGKAQKLNTTIEVNSKVDGTWQFMTPLMLASFRENGFNAIDDGDEIKQHIARYSKGDRYDQFIEDPTLIPVKVSYSSHMIFDACGGVEPVGIPINYISMGLSNEHYDLEKVLEVFLKDKRIKFKALDRRSQAIAPASMIQYVPYYNNDSGNRMFLDVVFMPTKQDANAMWAKQLTYKGQHPSARRFDAIKELNLLNIQQYAIKRD